MPEHVVLFAGPMGAGKTTAIRSLSDIEVVSTEAENTDRITADKATTTVALDYGEITVDDRDKVRLYGMPGQRRFDFMWSILKERAHGVLLLVNNDAAAPVESLIEHLDEFTDLHARGAVVVALSRTDVAARPSIAEYADALARSRPDVLVPIFTVDPRDRDQMRTVLMTLVANIELRALFATHGASE